jgi:hypothetical protein
MNWISDKRCAAFDDVAEHDVDWGESEVPYPTEFEAGEIGSRVVHYVRLKLIPFIVVACL